MGAGRSPEGGRSRAVRRFPVLLLPLALASCHAARPPTEPLPAGWRGDLAARWERVSTLRGEARISVRTPEGPYPGRMAMLLSRPGRLRLDFFTPFGTPEGIVILDGGSARADLHPDGQARLADLLRAMARDAEGVAAADVLGGLLVGLPPWPGAQTPEGLTLLPTIDRGSVVVASISIDREGEAPLRLGYAAYGHRGDVPLPSRVEVEAGDDRGTSVELTWMTLELNPPLDPALFAPTGAGDGD